MLKSLLIANRGEIARRIIRTTRRMGIRSTAVVTDADRSWPHWREADDAIAVDSYLSVEAIISAAREAGADSVHPGYGFLAENPALAEACEAAGLAFVGPPADAIRKMGSKAEAKEIMVRAGIPVVSGYAGERQEPDFLRQKAYEIGYPVLVKAVAGGGGRGMRRVERAIDFETELAAAKREARSAFGDDRVLLERYVNAPRHIEVQIFADSHDNVIYIFERDCSLQRRHQKIIEEAPAPGVTETMRGWLGQVAIRAAQAVNYRGAGTVEFLADGSADLHPGSIFFLEMNTRLQVEHPVTEAVTGLDLVEWQLRVAAGEALPHRQRGVALTGHAIEARIYAEDPADGFTPSTGKIWAASFPSGSGIRVDSGVEPGAVVGPQYDAMLAKLIVSGPNRDETRRRMAAALQQVRIAGPKTNLGFLIAAVSQPQFVAGGVATDFLDRAIETLAGKPADPAVAAGAISEWMTRSAPNANGACGPWARRDGFELGGLKRETQLAVQIDGVAVPVELAWAVDGARIVSIDGKPPAPAPDAEIIWGEHEAFLFLDGQQVRIAFPDPLARVAEDEASDGAVPAPIHGRVVDVVVAPGQSVAKGDLLFTLEAMKMEHSVVATVAGTVEAVHLAAGQIVEQGAAAIVIRPDSNALAEVAVK